MGIRTYALVGFCIISLLSTQYAFAQFAGCGPNEVRNVEGECVSAFADEPTEIGMRVSVNAFEGSTTISVSGHSSIKNNDITIMVLKPDEKAVFVAQVSPDANGDFVKDVQIGGSQWELNGFYGVFIKQGSSSLYSFVFPIEIVNGYTRATSITKSTLEVITPFTVSTDRSSYNDGDTIRISGNIGTLNENPYVPVAIMIIDPIGETAAVAQVSPSSVGSYSHTITAGGTMQISGVYDIIVTYGLQKASTTFLFSAGGFTPTPTPFDTTPPLILTPSDMTIDATDSSGARVDYSVKAIDDNDGVLRPNCSPTSGSLFFIGDTTVTCSATDNSGNSARKSFLITVNSPDVIIPSWVRDVAGFWCGDEIDDSSFIEAIQYLIDNDVIIVPTTASSGYGSQEIPNWIKNNACWWSQGLISSSDFASGLQYLIGQGIIRI